MVAAEEARPSPSLAGLAEERSTLPRMAEGRIHFRQTPLRSPTTREGVRRRTAEERSSPILPGSRSRFDLKEERLRQELRDWKSETSSPSHQAGEAAPTRVPEVPSSPEEGAAGSSYRRQSPLARSTRAGARSAASSSVASPSPIRRRRIHSRKTRRAAGAVRHRPSVPSAPPAASPG